MALGLIKRSSKLTVEELKQKLPSKKRTITQETVAYLNKVMEDPDFDSGTFINTMIDYQDVMINSRASIEEYVNAIKFVGYLEHEKSATESYKLARAQDKFVQDRWNDKPGTPGYDNLTTAATRYKKSKLVRQLLTQSDMPLYLMFQAKRYKAVQRLAEEMETAAYSKDRINAADKLLTHVKAPENVQVELEVGFGGEAGDFQSKLFDKIAEISMKQHKRLVAGARIEDVQQTGITTSFVDAEIEEKVDEIPKYD